MLFPAAVETSDLSAANTISDSMHTAATCKQLHEEIMANPPMYSTIMQRAVCHTVLVTGAVFEKGLGGLGVRNVSGLSVVKPLKHSSFISLAF